MSFRANFTPHLERWLAEIKAAPEPEGCEQVTCPACGDALIIRWGRNSEKWMVLHALTAWCDLRGSAWYGATRAEAIENFRKEGDELCSRSAPSVERPTAPVNVVASDAAPPFDPKGAATLQGWEFSAEGADEEEINKLLAMKV